MSTEKQAREQMAQQRLENEHLQESMLNRAEAEVQQGDNADTTEDLARQQMAQQRQEAEHIQEAMLTRTEAEITE